jgi:hypothetical protein
MELAVTKPLIYCSNCNLEKCENDFEKRVGRKINKTCRKCISEKRRLLYNSNEIIRNKHNEERRIKYQTDQEHRKQLIKQATVYKHNKIIERQKVKQEEAIKIGLENKMCGYCHLPKLKISFRHNRLKCKDCERDEPVTKLIKRQRTRIIAALKNIKKNKHTIEYLGCDCKFYLNWLLTNNPIYTFENYGKEWHIDHVIPLSKFNIECDEEQLIAFNWRNTMPLSVKENLSKNNKIIKSQIEQHYKKLTEYHIENKIEMPQLFIDLFAKHLVDGNSLKT